jgi:hypothetical protein
MLLNTDDVGIVVGNAHRRQITIPRMRKWLAKAASIRADRVRSFAMSINELR